MTATRVKFAMFCADVLGAVSDGDEDGEFVDRVVEGVEAEEYAKLFTRLVFEAMSEGSLEARDMFSRVLTLLEYESVREEFERLSGSVPAWLYLPWVSQMMALVQKAKYGASIVQLLAYVARAYPQAVIYPFMISSFGLEGEEADRMAAIDDALNIPARGEIEMFVRELNRTTHPKHRASQALRSLRAMVRTKDREAVVRYWVETVVPDVFDRSVATGSANKAFARVMGPLVKKAFGMDGAKLRKMKAEAVSEKAKELVEEIQGIGAKAGTDPGPGKHDLDVFSPWLAAFEAPFDATEAIHVPGQYSGDVAAPDVESLVRLVSVTPTTLVMRSMRLPKRLILHGNDEGETWWLVKGGEDVRLDERIQALFGVMNKVLAEDATCARRNLGVVRYAVVPMTPLLGVLEWVQNTKPVRGMIQDYLWKIQQERGAGGSSRGRSRSRGKGGQKKVILAWRKAEDAFRVGLLQGLSQKKDERPNWAKVVYPHVFQTQSASAVTTRYASAARQIPWDALRNSVLELAASPEAMLAVRSQLITSMAVSSICSYVIGIGDRHLDNFLLDLTTGAFVLIDFGHAFGSATQILGVPELMPFRLTPQFVNCLKPWNEHGVLKHTMRFTLEALQAARHHLLTVLDVFVKEPLENWSSDMNRLDREVRRELGKGPDAFSKAKLKAIKMKLSGYSSPAVMEYELRYSVHAKKPYMENLKKIIWARPDPSEPWFPKQGGAPAVRSGSSSLQSLARSRARSVGDVVVYPEGGRMRSGVGQRCKDVMQQVEVLLDHAGDENVLGRTYIGWGPFA